MSHFEAVIVPRGRLGIMAVTMGLLLHILTVLAITLIFHLRTRVSFIGQSWHAVAQMQNDAVIPILDKANLMRDYEVDRWLRDTDVDGNERFFIGKKLVDGGADSTISENQHGSSLRRRR